MAGKIGNRGDRGQNLVKLQGGFHPRRPHQVVGAIDSNFACAVERSLRIVLVIGNNGLDQGITGFFSRDKFHAFFISDLYGVIARMGNDPSRSVEEKQHTVVRYFLPFEGDGEPVQGDVYAEHTVTADQFLRAGHSGQFGGAEDVGCGVKGRRLLLGLDIPGPGAGIIVRIHVGPLPGNLPFPV